MKFTNIRDLKYIKADNSLIDLFATCEEYGEIPMTLNLVDTEDIHTFVKADGTEIPLEEYCKTLEIAPFDTEAYEPQKEVERVEAINRKVESIIVKPYPIYKQLNIRGQLTPYDMHDLENMNMFIDTVREIGKDAKESGIAVDEINWAGLDV